jgi:Fe-S cluster biogenesis protein NfuA
MTDPAPTLDDRRRSILERVEQILNRDVRAGLIADGGGIEVVGLDEDDILQVRLLGACQGCSSAVITLTMGIERALKAEIPELRFVEAVL